MEARRIGIFRKKVDAGQQVVARSCEAARLDVQAIGGRGIGGALDDDRSAAGHHARHLAPHGQAVLHLCDGVDLHPLGGAGEGERGVERRVISVADGQGRLDAHIVVPFGRDGEDVPLAIVAGGVGAQEAIGRAGLFVITNVNRHARIGTGGHIGAVATSLHGEGIAQHGLQTGALGLKVVLIIAERLDVDDRRRVADGLVLAFPQLHCFHVGRSALIVNLGVIIFDIGVAQCHSVLQAIEAVAVQLGQGAGGHE